jgi:hypothetical protein
LFLCFRALFNIGEFAFVQGNIKLNRFAAHHLWEWRKVHYTFIF